jgi:hypothetical protein
MQYELSNIQPYLLQSTLRKMSLDRTMPVDSTDCPLSTPPQSPQEIYANARIEFKFGTILTTLSSQLNQELQLFDTTQGPRYFPPIYQKYHEDIRKCLLPIAATAWVTSPEDPWRWHEEFKGLPECMQSLHYGLAWTDNNKSFLCACNDLAGISKVKFEDTQVLLYEQEECLRIVKTYYPNLSNLELAQLTEAK